MVNLSLTTCIIRYVSRVLTGKERMAKVLYLYCPDRKQMISLQMERVYLVDSIHISPEMFQHVDFDGGILSEAEHKGYRIDNYNMTNLFFE